MNPESSIERVVMRRVHRIHRLRPFISNGALAALVALLALYGIGREVWVARVFQNMPHNDPVAISRFYLAAFDHTRLVVQALAVTAFGAVIYLAHESAKVISNTLIASRA